MKKMIAVFISIVLLISVFPASAWAADNTIASDPIKAGVSSVKTQEDGFSEPLFMGRTGLKKLSPEQEKDARKDALVLNRVLLNETGLERVNEERKSLGKSSLPKSYATKENPLVTNQSTNKKGLKTAASSTPLPSQVDNSNTKYFPAIGNQGGLGACAAFSSTYYLGTYMNARAKGLDVKGTGTANIFSPKFIYNMGNDGVDEGSSDAGNLVCLTRFGCLTWADFAYKGNSSDPLEYKALPVTRSLWYKALTNRLKDWGVLENVDKPEGREQLKTMLADGYVVNFGTYIYDWQFNNVQNDTSTSADDAYEGELIAVKEDGESGGHSMTIVGYNDDIWVDLNGDAKPEENEKGAYKVANSWGTDWGNDGYVWISYDAVLDQSCYSYLNTRREPIISGDSVLFAEAFDTPYEPRVYAEFSIDTANRADMQFKTRIDCGEASRPRLGNIYDYGFTMGDGDYPLCMDGTTTNTHAEMVVDMSRGIKEDMTRGGTLSAFIMLEDKNSENGKGIKVNSVEVKSPEGTVVTDGEAIKVPYASYTDADPVALPVEVNSPENSLYAFRGEGVFYPDLPAPTNASEVAGMKGLTPGANTVAADTDCFKFTPSETSVYCFEQLSGGNLSFEILNPSMDTVLADNKTTFNPQYRLYAKKTYVIRVKNKGNMFWFGPEAAYSAANANLKTLNVEGNIQFGKIDKQNMQNYIEVPFETKEIQITAAAEAPGATVSGTGRKELQTGDNVFTVTVTARDGVTKKCYTIGINRIVSHNSFFSSISVPGYTISPDFQLFQDYYEVHVPDTVKSITILAAPQNSGSTITGTGVRALQSGENMFEITCTAQDGVSRESKYLRVIRNHDAANCTRLRTLAINGDQIQGFEFLYDEYFIDIPAETDQITIAAAPEENGAKLSGPTGTVALKPGDQTFEYTVTSANGKAQRAYKLNINRSGNSNSYLSGINVENANSWGCYGVFDFNPYRSSYTVNVPYSKISIKALTQDSRASVQTPGIITLKPGKNTATVKTTAQNGAQRTYSVTLNYCAFLYPPSMTTNYAFVPEESGVGFRTNLYTDLPYRTYAEIYTADGKWIANTPVSRRQTTDSPEYYWDTKVASGNGLKQKAGTTAPTTAEGTAYKTRIVVQLEKDPSIRVESDYTAFKLYKPLTIAKPVLKPVSKEGFTLDGRNRLRIETAVATPSNFKATVKAYIYNKAKGKWAACITLTKQKGKVVLSWDGKATAGNPCGYKAGSFVPSSVSGLAYYVKIYAFNDISNDKYSEKAEIKLYSGPDIKAFNISPKAFTVAASGKNKTKISFKLTRRSDVELRIYDASHKKLFAILKRADIAPNKTTGFYWDGKATAGNTAGLAAGQSVPAGDYRVVVYAAQTRFSPSVKIHVSIPKKP